MTMNIVEAEKMLNDEMQDDEIDFLLAARQGIALYDVPDAMLKTLQDHGLVDIIPFDNPRAFNAIKGVVPSVDGIKVLNVLDNRAWADSPDNRMGISADVVSNPQVDAVANAQDSRDNASEEGALDADDPRNQPVDDVAGDENRQDAVKPKSKKSKDSDAS